MNPIDIALRIATTAHAGQTATAIPSYSILLPWG